MRSRLRCPLGQRIMWPGIVALTIAALLPAPWTFSQPGLFPGNDDARWLSFQRGPCTLVEGVPIVKKTSGVTALDAALSSIIGYYEREFPILGPPIPRRVERLIDVYAKSRPQILDADQRDALAVAFYDIDERNFRMFRDFARASVGETDGTIRSRILSKLGLGSIDGLRQLARDRLQALTVERLQPTQLALLKTALDEKKLTLLQADSAYLMVGYADFGEMTLVIDPNLAAATSVPAERVLLTERDRKSTGEFATRAREVLKHETLMIDEVTSCKGKRPSGLRFLNPGRLGTQSELYVVRAWTLDAGQVQAIIKK